jgi:hypothetical protein
MTTATEVFTNAGIDLGAVSGPERSVLESLSVVEAEMLVSIKGRLDAVRPEVLGHGEDVGGIFW